MTKTNLLLLSSVVCTSLFACNGSDHNPGPNFSLIGKWKQQRAGAVSSNDIIEFRDDGVILSETPQMPAQEIGTWSQEDLLITFQWDEPRKWGESLDAPSEFAWGGPDALAVTAVAVSPSDDIVLFNPFVNAGTPDGILTYEQRAVYELPAEQDGPYAAGEWVTTLTFSQKSDECWLDVKDAKQPLVLTEGRYQEEGEFTDMQFTFINLDTTIRSFENGAWLATTWLERVE